MSAAEPPAADYVCHDVWCLIQHLYDKAGSSFFVFLFMALAFYRLVWRVWRVALESREAELSRLRADGKTEPTGSASDKHPRK